MFLKRLGIAGLIAGLGFAASACTNGYGYGGASVGYASSCYDGYGPGFGYGPGYGPGYGYAPTSYFGWYNDFYYPGTGIYVYDRYRRPVRWNGAQQRYWQQRARAYRGSRAQFRDNWQGFTRPGGTVRPAYPDRNAGAIANRRSQVIRQQLGTGRVDRRQYRQERQQQKRASGARVRSGRR